MDITSKNVFITKHDIVGHEVSFTIVTENGTFDGEIKFGQAFNPLEKHIDIRHEVLRIIYGTV